MRIISLIQLTGLIAIALLLAFTLPDYARRIPQFIASQAEQHLHAQGFEWASIQSSQVDNRNILISGTAPDTDQQRKAVNSIDSLWYVQMVEDRTTPRMIEPYTMHIQWKNGELSLEGFSSNEKSRATLARQAEAAFGNKVNAQKLQIAAGAPASWEDMISALLTAINPLQSASVRIIDRNVQIYGKAATTQEVNALKNAVDTLTDLDYDIMTNIVALDNAAVVCQREFNRLLALDKIIFESGGSSIDSISNNLLQELADAAIFCADSSIIITGHTDDVGSDADNLKLSEQRAKAVKGWLFNEGGVPLERLKTEGKGATEALADNTTEAGRAKNRRIEFIVEGI